MFFKNTILEQAFEQKSYLVYLSNQNEARKISIKYSKNISALHLLIFQVPYKTESEQLIHFWLSLSCLSQRVTKNKRQHFC